MTSFKQFILLEKDEEGYSPPEGARNAARKALKFRDDYGDQVKAGTRVGWTRANQLANGEKLSLDVVKRMHSFFSRHSGNQKVSDEHKGEPWKDNGYVSWLLWGGDVGKSWAEKIVNNNE